MRDVVVQVHVYTNVYTLSGVVEPSYSITTGNLGEQFTDYSPCAAVQCANVLVCAAATAIRCFWT